MIDLTFKIWKMSIDSNGKGNSNIKELECLEINGLTLFIFLELGAFNL
jgi:hypothetical protein